MGRTRPKETEVYQLSLFPTIEETESARLKRRRQEKYIMPAAFSLPKEQLEAILRTGGGQDNSRSRIMPQVPAGQDTGGNGGVSEKRIPDYRERL